MGKRIVAAFDFDGTLTCKDTFTGFIAFCFGKRRMYTALLQNIHLIFAYKMGLYPNDKAKQAVFSHCFKGMAYTTFADFGSRYAAVIDTMLKRRQYLSLLNHADNGDNVYIVSASIREWIEPWSKSHGVHAVIATEVETDDNGCLTGRFATRNCHGQEKVNRFLAIEPNRESYLLYAYGDSSGDKQLLAIADRPTLVR